MKTALIINRADIAAKIDWLMDDPDLAPLVVDAVAHGADLEKIAVGALALDAVFELIKQNFGKCDEGDDR